jgi:tetratricopeptide (TPR) repeat protein
MYVTVDQVGVGLQRATYWSLHFGRVSFWLLCAVACALLAARLALLEWSRVRLASAGSVRLPTPRAVRSWLSVSLCGLAVSIFFVLKPDTSFFLAVARGALERGDYARAVQYYKPVAQWGTTRPEIYENLGLSYLQLGHYAEAVEALHRAEALDPTPEAYVLCSWAHERLGEVALAEQHLARARSLSRSPAQSAAIEASLQRLRTGSASSRSATPSPQTQ